MKTSDAGLDLICEKEALSLKAYRDGGGVLTIGYGHTQGVVEHSTIDIREAYALFAMDLAPAEAQVNQHVTTPLNQCQYDALVSFEFNTGGLVLSGGVPSKVLLAVNERRWCDAVEELVRWNMDNGKDVRGLLIRRLEEGLMFASEPWPSAQRIEQIEKRLA